MYSAGDTEAHSRSPKSSGGARGSPRIGQRGCTRGAGELGAENSAWVIEPL
jgi:hypothetical protein